MAAESIEVLIDLHDGNAWQNLACQLLLLRYGGENLQLVPDEHKGDWGIEAYTLDGLAFQCYAPAQKYSVQDLYNHQRAKMTDDIGKFIENEKHLAGLIRPVKYRRWIFLTTIHTSKELNAHAAKKAELVRGKCEHVTDDFAVLVHTGNEYFFEEVGRYIRQGMSKLNIRIPSVSDQELQDHLRGNSLAYQTLSRKLMSGDVDAAHIDSLAKEYVNDFLVGQNLLASIKGASPELYEIIEKKKTSLENDTLKKYRINKTLTAVDLDRDLQALKGDLAKEAHHLLDSSTIDYLARGVVADWLIRCPMDF